MATRGQPEQMTSSSIGTPLSLNSFSRPEAGLSPVTLSGRSSGTGQRALAPSPYGYSPHGSSSNGSSSNGSSTNGSSSALDTSSSISTASKRKGTTKPGAKQPNKRSRVSTMAILRALPTDQGDQLTSIDDEVGGEEAEEDEGEIDVADQEQMLRQGNFWENDVTRFVVDWLSNVGNYQRLMNPRPISGNRVVDIQQEITTQVNERLGLECTISQIKSKIAYIKKLYRQAVNMNSTGAGGDILERQEARCPPFQRLDASFSSSLALNHPPIRQTGVPHPRPTIEDLTPDVEAEEAMDRRVYRSYMQSMMSCKG